MKNLKHPYPFALLLGLSLCAPHLQAADTIVAGQAVGQISATVPKTLLLAIENVTPTITYTKPTQAGQSFGFPDVSNSSAKLAFTSNVAGAKLYAKARVTKLGNDQELNSSQTLDSNNLLLSAQYNNETKKPLSYDDNYVIANIGNKVSGIISDNSNTNTLTLDGGLRNMDAVPPHGTYGITVTYTLKES
ncbi:MAG: hypothetical protein BWK73_37165 [Thiothrix lacustris]|uniref:DUF4402 domain-containing protein n=1 Tax=Thiothrix lacustris TaxID=525917 RepID=A0A1Y1QF46_9GAMM|nr:MAG: hypothetical protein BWK73_37165 [Thiothrix lacustris]